MQLLSLTNRLVLISTDRSKVKSENSDWKSGEVTKELNRLWKLADINTKQRFEEAHGAALAAYTKDMAESVPSQLFVSSIFQLQSHWSLISTAQFLTDSAPQIHPP